jgi:hypothetical protein
MAGDGNFKWWIAASEDSEYWTGPFATRDQAVAKGTAECAAGEYEGRFWVFEADKAVCVPRVHSDRLAEAIIEDIGENNVECWSEDGWDDEWPDGARKDLERSIDEMVAAWMKRFPPHVYGAGDVRVSDEVVVDTVKAAADGE